MALPDLEKSDLLLHGEVTAVGPAPQIWSGQVAAFQTVEYRVEAVFKGKAATGPARIEHLVVKDSPVARRDRPGLSPEFFRRGARLLVGAQAVGGQLVCTYVQPWAPEAEQALRGALPDVGGPRP
jgi:hypothetical protein